MKKMHKMITISFDEINAQRLQCRICEILDEGWKLERVDSPHGGKILVYLFSKEE
jgi:hypothetical protein